MIRRKVMKRKLIAVMVAAQMLVTLCPAGTVMAAEAESTQAVEEENDQAAGAENTQAVEEENDQAAGAENTQAVEEENDQAAGAENTQAAEEESEQADEENTQAVVVEQDEDTQLYGATAESNFSWDGDTITGYNGSSTKVVIPGRAKKIGYRAFSEKNVVSVEIPDSVTEIGNFAFAECTSLTSIVIPKNVSKVGVGVF